MKVLNSMKVLTGALAGLASLRVGESLNASEQSAITRQLTGCNAPIPDWIGDGYCDAWTDYNNPECGYDGGDCCESTCVDDLYNCGEWSSFQCIDPNASENQNVSNNCDTSEEVKVTVGGGNWQYEVTWQISDESGNNLGSGEVGTYCIEKSPTNVYRISMSDSYGDGWNGNDLCIHGNPDGTSTCVTLNSGYSGTDYIEFESHSVPVAVPSAAPANESSLVPVPAPSAAPVAAPSAVPVAVLSAAPTNELSSVPVLAPSAAPVASPTSAPSLQPTTNPSSGPTIFPSADLVSKDNYNHEDSISFNNVLALMGDTALVLLLLLGVGYLIRKNCNNNANQNRPTAANNNPLGDDLEAGSDAIEMVQISGATTPVVVPTTSVFVQGFPVNEAGQSELFAGGIKQEGL